MAIMTEIYEKWDNFQIKQAYNLSTQLLKKTYTTTLLEYKFMPKKTYDLINFQNNILQKLSTINLSIKTGMELLNDKEICYNFLFTIYQNSIRRKEQKKYDMASLLNYRTLELIMQIRLSSYGLNTYNPNYKACFKINQLADIQKQLLQYRRLIYKSQDNTLKDNLTLMEGYLFLAAIKDQFFEHINTDRTLKEIFDYSMIRNNNIFAHGFLSVELREYEKIENLTVKFIQILCEIDNISFEEYKIRNTFYNNHHIIKSI